MLWVEVKDNATDQEREFRPRRLASNDVASDWIELCETEVCFLHIQLVGTNVPLPKKQQIPSRSILSFS